MVRAASYVPRMRVSHYQRASHRVLQETDGVITFDAAGYHPEATTAFRTWFAETSRKVYFSGPLVAPAAKGASEEKGDGVLAFLDSQLASHGARCVVYVSSA